MQNNNTRKFDHITPALHDLKWLPIDLHLLYRETVMTFKCINDLAPPHLCSKFKKRSAIHHQSTRSSDTLNIPLFRTTSGQRSFSYRGAKIWNNLDEELREITSLHHFKEGSSPTYSKSIMDHSILARHKIDHFGFLYSIYFIKISLQLYAEKPHVEHSIKYVCMYSHTNQKSSLQCMQAG